MINSGSKANLYMTGNLCKIWKDQQAPIFFLLKISVVDILQVLECFCEEDVDEECWGTDLPLLEVGLSSAQYGALVVESVCVFFWEHVCNYMYIKVVVSCIFSVIMPAPLRACVYLGVCRSVFAPLWTPCEANIAVVGELSQADQARAA